VQHDAEYQKDPTKGNDGSDSFQSRLFVGGDVEHHADEKDDRGESNEGGNRFHGYNFPILSIRLPICRLTRRMPIATDTTPPAARAKVRGAAVSAVKTSQPVKPAKVAIPAPSQTL
jgi:hypothetical protein